MAIPSQVKLIFFNWKHLYVITRDWYLADEFLGAFYEKWKSKIFKSILLIEQGVFSVCISSLCRYFLSSLFDQKKLKLIYKMKKISQVHIFDPWMSLIWIFQNSGAVLSQDSWLRSSGRLRKNGWLDNWTHWQSFRLSQTFCSSGWNHYDTTQERTWPNGAFLRSEVWKTVTLQRLFGCNNCITIQNGIETENISIQQEKQKLIVFALKLLLYYAVISSIIHFTFYRFENSTNVPFAHVNRAISIMKI